MNSCILQQCCSHAQRVTTLLYVQYAGGGEVSCISVLRQSVYVSTEIRNLKKCRRIL